MNSSSWFGRFRGRLDEWSDEALMVRVACSERAANEELYARYKRPVFSFLCRRTGTRAAAEEAHQETWLRVYRFRDRFDRTRRFKAWLFAIAANCGHDAVRPDPTLFELVLEPADPVDLRDRLVSALSAVRPEDRTVLLMAAEGFTAPEIAEALDLSPGAVRTRIYRARRQVRESVGRGDA